jgi:hypothetical protein
MLKSLTENYAEVLKIDVESSGVEVLASAPCTLRKTHKTSIEVETANPTAVLATLKSAVFMRYTWFGGNH